MPATPNATAARDAAAAPPPLPDLLLDWSLPFVWRLACRLDPAAATLAALALALAHFAYHSGARRFRLRPNGIVPAIRRNFVLVTGCDSGFGRQLALSLLRRGVNVFAGCFSAQGAEELKMEAREYTGSLITIPLDITDQNSVDHCFDVVASVLEETGAQLWSLVNNAGFCAIYGPNDWVTVEEYKASIEVNLLGAIRMTQKFVPLLKRSRGRLVTMVSISGRVHGFYTAPYVTAKFGLEGFMDSVRLELLPFGVTCHILEPGAFKTALLNKKAMLDRVNRTWNKLPEEVREEYGYEFKENFVAQWMSGVDLVANADVSEVVNAYQHAILATRPRARYVCGADARLLFVPLSFLPAGVQDRVLGFLPRLQFAPALVPWASRQPHFYAQLDKQAACAPHLVDAA